MPIFDYRCDNCEWVEEVLQVHNTDDKTFKCKCGGTFRKAAPMTPPSFELKYNNKTDMCDWGGRSSRYWDDYKKAKSQGLDVKPHGED